MDSTRLYGYDPTHWLAILFAVYCFFTLCAMTFVLFIRHRNVALGMLVTVGLLFQLTGHVSVAVSSFTHNNFSAWATQRVAFTLGKITARVLVMYVYYTCFLRIMAKKKHILMLFPLMGLAGAGFIIRSIGLGFEISSLIGNVTVDRIMVILPAALLFSASALLAMMLIYVILRSRTEVPWYRPTWMTGYYVTLQLVPFFIMAQDLYDFSKGFVSERNEMLELTFDMGMTKSILAMLGGQSYEVALAWSQKPPKPLEKIVFQLNKIFGRRRQSSSEQK